MDYFVTGSVAAIVYGEPRFTNDIDIVVNLKQADLPALAKVFDQDTYYLPPLEVLQTEFNRPNRGHFNIIHMETMFKCDAYCAGDDILHGWAFENKRAINFMGSQIMLALPEYVIIRKLEFYQEGSSPKHLTDIEAILKNSVELIDFEFLESEIRTRNLSTLWDTKFDNANH